MFEKLICALFGLEVRQDKGGTTIHFDKLQKKHPNFTKRLLTNLVIKMAEDGANVVINVGSKKLPDKPEN